jgi:hypothetical protein
MMLELSQAESNFEHRIRTPMALRYPQGHRLKASYIYRSGFACIDLQIALRYPQGHRLETPDFSDGAGLTPM